MGALIEVQDLHKRFRLPQERRNTVREQVLGLFRPMGYRTLHVLRGVSFSVGAGESFGIMGRNGCGKSTLLKILSGIFPADQGRVRVGARVTPILELGAGWNPELNAIDNILLVGTAMGLSLSQARQAIEPVLAFAELEAFAQVHLKHYSSGMAARLAYALAFHAAGPVVVLDEIFAVGDAGFKARCEERYRQLARAGHTILIVSHDPRVVGQFCQRGLLLEQGQVALEGSGAEVAQAYLAQMGLAPASVATSQRTG